MHLLNFVYFRTSIIVTLMTYSNSFVTTSITQNDPERRKIENKCVPTVSHLRSTESNQNLISPRLPPAFSKGGFQRFRFATRRGMNFGLVSREPEKEGDATGDRRDGDWNGVERMVMARNTI